MEGAGTTQQRDVGIIRTSVIGIVANVLLAAFKASVGLAANSIAVILDAVNNLTDALSSVITIVGTRLANKPADRKHPFGHGRTEYVTTFIIAAIVAWAGVTSLIESVQRILSPQQATYQTVTLVVMAVAVGVKIALGLYTRGRGRALISDSLVASGTDALMDAIISTSTLVAALLYLSFGVSLEGWLGAGISLVIIKSGVDILREAIDHILGARIDAAVSVGVKRTIETVPGVQGAYDLVLHDLGPDRLAGSVHVEVDEDLSAREIDVLTRAVQSAVMREHGIMLHTVGIYSTNTNDGGDVGAIRSTLLRWAEQDELVLEVHGFYVDVETRTVSFDLVVSWDAPDRQAVVDRMCERLAERFAGYDFQIALDSDVSD